MPYPNLGDYKGWTGLSPPVAYPSIMEYEEMKVASSLEVYAIDYCSSVVARVIRLYQGPSTRALATRTDDEPANK
jgi:hypothetical protein